MPEAYSSVPDALKVLPNWVAWQMGSKDGKPTKIPYSFHGGLASSTNSKTWIEFDKAKQVLPNNTGGIGFVFDGKGIVGIDLDHCLQEDNTVSPKFKNIIENLKSYTEVSPSGKGLHIFVRCSEKPYPKGIKVGDFEIYSEGRFFTVTGNKWNGCGSEVVEYPADLVRSLCNPFIQQNEDDKIITRAKKAKNGELITNLLTGILTGYKSASEADAALATLLAFYTKDVHQIERIMRKSGLFRAKWDEHPSYLTDTIRNSITLCGTASYTPSERKPSKKHQNTEEGQRMTEVEVAEMFVEHLNGDYLYNATTKQWHIWNGKVWCIDDRNGVLDAARQFVKTLYARASECDENTDINDLIYQVKKINSKVGVMNIVALAGIQLTRTSDDFDQNIHLLNLQNGTLVFGNEGVTFKEHDRNDMCSYIGNTVYDKDAVVPQIWKDHIHIISLEDADMESNIQELLGYTLDGGNLYELFYLFHGEGRNGKSVTLREIEHILGDYALNVNHLTLMEHGNKTVSPERLKMVGRKLIISQEPNKVSEDSHQSSTACLDAGFLKAASGKDKISARSLFSNTVKEITITGVIVLSTNPLPKVTDDTKALWERLIAVPFRYSFPTWMQDPNIGEKFKEASPGILNWMIEGWERVRKRRIPLCDAIKDDIAAYRLTVDEYSIFVTRCVEETFDGELSAKALFTEYLAYQKREGCSPNTDTSFYIAMKKRFNWKRTANGIVYKGIKIRSLQASLEA